ncbi:MAG TPA: carbon storage regulator CsrA [Bacteroidota bacterium]|nr:carbon storage regulator CsrA [Bacteroidota bacterium]
MLVLARRVNESIRIGDKIIVKVLAIQEGQVKLGIEAPQSIEILRWEVYEQIVRNNQQAATSQKRDVTEAAKRLPSSARTELKGVYKVNGQKKNKQKNGKNTLKD